MLVLKGTLGGSSKIVLILFFRKKASNILGAESWKKGFSVQTSMTPKADVHDPREFQRNSGP